MSGNLESARFENFALRQEVERLRADVERLMHHVRKSPALSNEYVQLAEAEIARLRATIQPSAATENPEAMYSPVAREGHAGASARQIDVAAGDQLVADQPERCCLDYPRCDCNSPPEPDNLPCGHPASPDVGRNRRAADRARRAAA